MLDVKHNRLDYGELLIPPTGFRLSRAIATTFSLDLNTLLSIPMLYGMIAFQNSPF